MRRVLFLVAILVLTSLVGNANAEQGSWQPRLSLYSGSLGPAVYISRDVVVAAGGGGLLRSQDAGHSWSWAINGPLTGPALAGDGISAWTTGRNGRIFATADGGRTWSQQQSRTDLNLFDVAAFDAQSAIVLGEEYRGSTIPPFDVPDHVILRTDDGGQSWQPVPFLSAYWPRSVVSVRGGNRAWMTAQYCPPKVDAPDTPPGCAWESASFLSDDLGKTWMRTDEVPQPWSTSFVSAEVGWSLDGYALKRTEDGGKTWTTVREWRQQGPYPRNLSVLGVEAVVLVESGTDGSSQIVKTVDGGETWSNIGEPRNDLGAVTSFDTRSGVSIWTDRDTRISWTGDGGLTWNVAETPMFGNSLIFDFVGTTGWAVAQRLLRTDDGGLTWQPVSDLQPAALDFVSSSEGWAIERRCGDYPCTYTLLHSVDGGATWEEQTSVSTTGTLLLKFVDAQNGWVETSTGTQYSLLRTRDGGKTWEQQYTPSEALDFVDAEVIWAAGYGAPGEGNVEHPFVSLDGGDTWSLGGSLKAQGRLYVLGFDATHAWAVSEEYGNEFPPFAFYRTVDGGVTWEQLGARTYGPGSYLKFFSPSDGIAVKYLCSSAADTDCPQALLRTFDGGLTWNVELTEIDLHGAVFSDLWHGWALGYGEPYGYENSSVTLYSYSATPQVAMPGVGEGHRDEAPTIPLAAFSALGVLLVGAGGFVRLRRRREGKTGG